MLIEKDFTNKSKSIYRCDRCRDEINWDNKVAIYVGIKGRTIKKNWDLCQKCYKALVRGIKKGKVEK